MDANLKDIKYLNKLVSEWSLDSDGTIDEDVLDALQLCIMLLRNFPTGLQIHHFLI